MSQEWTQHIVIDNYSEACVLSCALHAMRRDISDKYKPGPVKNEWLCSLDALFEQAESICNYFQREL